MSRLLIVAACLAMLASCTGSQRPARLDPVGDQPASGLHKAGAEVLFWTQEQRDSNFRRMERIFPTRVVKAGGRMHKLPRDNSIEPTLGKEAIDTFISNQNIAGLIVLADGRVRLERYARGFGPDQRWTSFSVAKSLTSTLVGAAIRDGFIGSVEDLVVRYIPELRGSAYDGVTVGQVLTMTSGVRWNEDYEDPKSDVARMFADTPPPGSDVTVAYLRNLGRAAEPGTRWNYNTAETNLIGVIVSRATGRSLADYASEKIWRAYGMEADAYWQLDEHGHEIAGCCLSARLRDYARIGQFVLDRGRIGGRWTLPPDWIGEATRMHQPFADGRTGYGYQWWIGATDYSARGIFGQMIWIDPGRRTVIVALSAWPAAVDSKLSADREKFFRRAAEAAERKD